MDIKTILLYTVYVVILVIVVLAGFFHVLPQDLVMSTFTLVVGHFLGLVTPTPTKSDTATPTNTVG